VNLFYLLSNRHRQIAVGGDVTAVVLPMDDLRWRGVLLPAEEGAFVSVLKATDCQPFRSRPSSVGWQASAPEGPATIEVGFVVSATGAPVGEATRLDLDERPRVIRLPWPVQPPAEPMDLVVRQAKGSTGSAFIGVHYPLDRRPLVALCKGKGVELGPGPRPQIFPGEGVDVSFVEQTHPDQWASLYGGSSQVTFDPALAGRYVVGNANEIPAGPESLDFIFSSHVFEHLANPLGHLELWSRLLKPGGKIVMIVPDYIGSKDFLMDETPMDELEDEYRSGGFDVSERHYQAYGKARGNPDLAARLIEKQASIHVHYYSHGNMARVCEWAVEKLGYSAFTIQHSDNHKDFYVILEKAAKH
jgi:SAM-dependent methyltransferase